MTIMKACKCSAVHQLSLLSSSCRERSRLHVKCMLVKVYPELINTSITGFTVDLVIESALPVVLLTTTMTP